MTVLYSATSGLWGVVVTDLLLFVIAMVGSVAAAYFALIQPEVGGLTGLISNPELQGKLSFLPDFTDWRTAAAVFIVPVAVQWWSTWYPGAEPGGGGYVAQRMLAARDEKEAMGATLWFNVAHYALRPWPWILVALASLLVYPSLESIQAAFPNLDPSIIRNDLAYPAMLVFLPHGLAGHGGGVPGRGLHVHHQHPSELGRLLRGGRFLPAVHQRLGGGPALRDGGAVDHGGPHRPGRDRIPLAGERPSGLPDPPPDRRRNRVGLPPPVVLVEGQRLERDGGHVGFFSRGRLLPVRPHGAGVHVLSIRRLNCSSGWGSPPSVGLR